MPTSKTKENWTIWGISELACWLSHDNPTCQSPSGRDAEDCLDAHLACGIDHVVWDLGRSVLAYHSDLPGATMQGLRDLPPDLNASQRAIEGIYRERCQLRAALRHARSCGMKLYGRLCMNRHYRPGSHGRGAFVDQHPQWLEVGEDGWVDTSRMCYGIPEVRQERIEIFKECVQIGVDGVHLDFCRQPPMVRYHPVFVNGFRKKTGLDPFQLDGSDKEDFRSWCAYRAESITTLLRELKVEIDFLRDRLQRPIPVQVRVPNDGFEANLFAGLDLETWCREGLIDELALSELHWLEQYQHWDDAPYIALGNEHDIPVFASSNCLPLQGSGWHCAVNPKGINPLVLARRAWKSHQAGARGIAFYQSDTGIQMPGVRDAVSLFHDPAKLEEFINDPEMQKRYPVTPENASYGIDNHSADFAQFRVGRGETQQKSG